MDVFVEICFPRQTRDGFFREKKELSFKRWHRFQTKTKSLHILVFSLISIHNLKTKKKNIQHFRVSISENFKWISGLGLRFPFFCPCSLYSMPNRYLPRVSTSFELVGVDTYLLTWGVNQLSLIMPFYPMQSTYNVNYAY